MTSLENVEALKTRLARALSERAAWRATAAKRWQSPARAPVWGMNRTLFYGAGDGADAPVHARGSSSGSRAGGREKERQRQKRSR
jgi:hypothetical protein